MPYKLGLRAETASTAVWKWWKLRRRSINSYIEGETYTVRFKFKNLSTRPFLGGDAVMRVTWPNGIFVIWSLTIPQLNNDQTEYGTFDDGSAVHSGEIITSGFGLVFCDEIGSSDQQEVILTDLDGQTPYVVGSSVNAIHSIKARTWTDLYANYSMIVSAVGLAIVALDRVIACVLWLLPRLDP